VPSGEGSGLPAAKPKISPLEQKKKNWTHVRTLLGWERYDSRAAVDISDLYRHELRLWLNF
jgi:hypothetical protein